MAEQAFRDVKRAYEVLSDPHTRAVYDNFGEAGLESQWAVACLLYTSDAADE